MEVQEITEAAFDAVTAKRVYGEPFETKGLTVIPAATVTGVGLRGTSDDGSGPNGDGSAEGRRGGGFGLTARPSGAWVIDENGTTWKPAVDVNRIIFGGQLIALVAIVVTGRILAGRSGRHGGSPRFGPTLVSVAHLLLRLPKLGR
jgi:hypothetical protein